ncbi:hypothetical protein [Tardiphaga sp. 42S5]|uniref:hypothetical protein n=1 Tax=Tardiphaga sp. 42S5 TaxID=1404799 RepID=UPI002A59BEE4|nr:hypothetical protein [Tardiphaga sp. 42S5]WPO40627.1 hypothetical protein SFY93_24340 [Tardiphaga sp. 42S5]
MVGAAVMMTAPVFAQDNPPIVQRPVTTERIVRPAGNPELYEVGINGIVYVDWKLVATMASAPRGHPQQAVAQMMLAVRDGKSKDLSERR